jgi:hypothetical protein
MAWNLQHYKTMKRLYSYPITPILEAPITINEIGKNTFIIYTNTGGNTMNF